MAHAQAYRRVGGRMPRAPMRRQGSWKLAYADFLTALVALFLVLWLVRGVSGEERAGLADYFSGTPTQELSPADTQVATDGAARLALHLMSDPRLASSSPHVEIIADANLVRIEIVDRLDDPLFDTGAAQLTGSGREVLKNVAEIVRDGTWPFSIEGHTDAFPHSGSAYDNWSLSAARAEAARIELAGTGLDMSRLCAVTGLAASRPLRPAEPHLATNRRVTLVLHVSE